MKYFNAQTAFIFLSLLFIISCDNDIENQNLTLVKYQGDNSCGYLLTINNELVNSSCESYQDSLLTPSNHDDFEIFEKLQLNDEIYIEYEIRTELCEGGGKCIINRIKGGIPIKIICVREL